MSNISAILKIINAGGLVTFQDLGRFGHNHLGLTTGGTHDPYAFQIANALVGNNYQSTALEITMGQFSAQVLATCTLALTGPDVALSINKQRVNLWQSHRVKYGDIIEISTPICGLRHTLAISGGIAARRYFSSTSTVLREGLGQRLQSGNIIKQHAYILGTEKKLNAKFISHYNKHALNVVLGLQAKQFKPSEINRFFATEYRVKQQSDKMGYRLSGISIESPNSVRYSEGINLGAIQIPADGQPIILLNDRQTIGGYPKIGSVTALDCAKLLQYRPDEKVLFQPINVEQAQSNALLAHSKLNRAIESLN
jgi:biotin-dependent carboxylase-like uncharacterized protein